MKPRKGFDLCSRHFWERTWKEARESSILKATQRIHPERWSEFYDGVADLWLDLWGERGRLGEAIAEEMASQGLIREGMSLLDVGSGPGTLALPLARLGARVTAVDRSPEMLRQLTLQATRKGLKNLDLHRADWRDFQPGSTYDLVVAAFFPQAMEPAGLRRLEGWSSGSCLLVLGTGQEPFPFRQRLWPRLMDVPFPDTRRSLVCALNYLLATGRQPNLRHLCLPVSMDLPLPELCRFYRGYFAIFGVEGPVAERTIRKVLAGYARHGRVGTSGCSHLALLWWNPPKDRTIRCRR